MIQKTYIKVMLDDSFFPVKRAVAVLEKAGIIVGNGMIIHHKDEDKTNDSLSNLEIMPIGQHNALHGRVKIPPNKNLAWCNKCKKFKLVTDFCSRESHWNGLRAWCKACAAEYSRFRRAERRQR